MTGEVGSTFMRNTQHERLSPSDQQKGVPQPPLELGWDEARPTINLPTPNELPDDVCDLRTAIENRRSVRQYSGQVLTLKELSFLLWCTQGVRETVDSYATLRNVPSAGARHALETYLLINNVAELRPGLYRFLATAHRLAEVDTADGLADKMTAACWGQSQVRQSAVTFFWVAIPYRMTWRYGERGYRYLHLDAGHVCQNLYLAAEVIGAGVCAIAAFQDAALNSLLSLDGERQFVIYLATVGRKHAPSVA